MCDMEYRHAVIVSAAETSCCAAVSYMQSGQVDCLERGRGSGLACSRVVPSKWSGRGSGIQLSLNENMSDEAVMHLCTYSSFFMFSYINFWLGTLRKLVQPPVKTRHLP